MKPLLSLMVISGCGGPPMAEGFGLCANWRAGLLTTFNLLGGGFPKLGVPF